MIRDRCSLLMRQYLWVRSCTGAEETSWSSTTTCLAQTVTVCWRNTQSLLEGLLLVLFPELSPIFVLFQDHSGSASSYFFLLPHPSCVIFWGIFLFVCFPLLFQVCIPVLHCKYNPAAFLLVPDFLLKSENPEMFFTLMAR